MDSDRDRDREHPRDEPDADDTRVEKRPRRETNGEAKRDPSPAPAPPAAHQPQHEPTMGARRRKVLLANLPYDVTDHQVQNFFERHRLDVDTVKLLGINPAKRQCNGNAFVYFVDDRSVANATSLDQEQINGRSVRIYDFNGQRTACVKCLRGQPSKVDVQSLFDGCSIDDVRSGPPRHYPNGEPMNATSTWFVDFSDDASFEKALAHDRSDDGVVVCVATPGRRAQPGGWRRDDRRDDRRDRPARSPPYARAGAGGGGRGDYNRFDDRRDRDRYDGGVAAFRDAPRGFDRHDRDRNDMPPRGDSRDGSDPPNSVGRPRDRGRFDRDPGYGQVDRRGSFDRSRDRRGDQPYRPRDVQDRGGFRDRDRFHSRRDDPMDRKSSPLGDRDRFQRGPPDGDDGYRTRGPGGRDGDRDRPWQGRPDRFQKDWEGDNGRDRFQRRDRDDYRQRRDNRYQRNDDRDRRPRGSYERPEGRPEFISGLIESAINEANRFCGDVEEDLTIVISSLPFQDDRRYMSEQIRAAFTDVHPDIKIKYIFPAGRRCGHCFVVFEDKESRDLALAMRMVTVFERPANVHPLEKPYLVRFHKLPPNHTADRVASELKQDFEIDGVRAATDFGEFCFFRIGETKDFVRLLAIDGFPYQNGRLVSVSYYQGKRPFSAGGQRRNNRDFDDDRRDRGGDYRPGSGGDYHQDRGGGGGGEPPSSGDGRNDGSAQDRGYQNDSGATKHEWVVRLKDLPKGFTTDEVLEFANKKGIFDIGVEKTSETECRIHGRRNKGEALRKTLALNEAEFVDRQGSAKKFAAEEVTPRRPINTPQAAVHPKSEPAKEGSAQPKSESMQEEAVQPSSEPRQEGPVQPSSEPMQDGPDANALKRPFSGPDGNDRGGKKANVSRFSGSGDDDVDVKNTAISPRISPLTPPSPKDDENGDTVMLDAKAGTDPNMPSIRSRFKAVKKMIMSDDYYFEESKCFEELCKETLKPELNKKQELKHSADKDIDMDIPTVWRGDVFMSNGPKALVDAHYVWRDDTDSDSVRRDLAMIPKELHIESRVPRDHPGYSHMLTKNANVFLMRASQKEYEKLSLVDKKSRTSMSTSRSKILGMIKYLNTKRRLGLVRIKEDGQDKNVALFIPPDAEIMEQLDIPWRFQHLISHDALLVILGEKARSATVNPKTKKAAKGMTGIEKGIKKASSAKVEPKKTAKAK